MTISPTARHNPTWFIAGCGAAHRQRQANRQQQLQWLIIACGKGSQAVQAVVGAGPDLLLVQDQVRGALLHRSVSASQSTRK